MSKVEPRRDERAPAPAPSATAAPGPAPRQRLREELIGWAKSLAAAVLIWIVLRSYLIEAFRIPSASMENTLLVGDFLFVDKAAYGGELEIPLTGVRLLPVRGYSEPRRDGIVVFRSVEDSTPNLNIVKRVIGAPGDTLGTAPGTPPPDEERPSAP